jgi:hypothetical protein
MGTVKYDLHTRLSTGRATLIGRIVGDEVIFDHPNPGEIEGPIVLRVTRQRADQIAQLHRHVQDKMNLRIERTEIHTGRDFRRELYNVIQCPYCYADVTWIDEDFLLHALPFCREWVKKCV